MVRSTLFTIAIIFNALPLSPFLSMKSPYLLKFLLTEKEKDPFIFLFSCFHLVLAYKFFYTSAVCCYRIICLSNRSAATTI